jgi:hypothetical protein
MDRPNRKTKTASASKRQGKSADDLLSEIEYTMGESWLAAIYRDRILKLRTRSYVFPLPAKPGTKPTTPEIQHTLLGIELKAGHQRMLCPDLATARYLAVFVRVGCGAVAIPYDITTISHLADDLESSWHRMLLLAESLAGDRSEAFATRLRGLLVGKVRDEIAAAGAGTRIPEFKQSTKERERPQKGARGNE